MEPDVRAFVEAWGLELDRVLPRRGIALAHMIGVGPNAPRSCKRLLLEDGRVFHARFFGSSASDTPFDPKPVAGASPTWMSGFRACALEEVRGGPGVRELPGLLDGGIDVLLLRLGGVTREVAFRGAVSRAVRLIGEL